MNLTYIFFIATIFLCLCTAILIGSWSLMFFGILLFLLYCIGAYLASSTKSRRYYSKSSIFRINCNESTVNLITLLSILVWFVRNYTVLQVYRFDNIISQIQQSAISRYSDDLNTVIYQGSIWAKLFPIFISVAIPIASLSLARKVSIFRAFRFASLLLISVIPSTSSSLMITSLILSVPLLTIAFSYKDFTKFRVAGNKLISSLKLLFLILASSLLFFSLTQLLRVGFQGSNIASGSLLNFTYERIVIYSLSPFIGLDNFLNNHEFTGFNFFVRSFGRVIAIFYQVDLGGGAQMEPFFSRIIDIPVHSNLYTVYRFIIEDFDYAGIILLVVLLGYLVERVTSSPTNFVLRLYVFIVPFFLYYPSSIYYQASTLVAAFVLQLLIRFSKLRQTSILPYQ